MILQNPNTIALTVKKEKTYPNDLRTENKLEQNEEQNQRNEK